MGNANHHFNNGLAALSTETSLALALHKTVNAPDSGPDPGFGTGSTLPDPTSGSSSWDRSAASPPPPASGATVTSRNCLERVCTVANCILSVNCRSKLGFSSILSQWPASHRACRSQPAESGREQRLTHLSHGEFRDLSFLGTSGI